MLEYKDQFSISATSRTGTNFTFYISKTAELLGSDILYT